MGLVLTEEDLKRQAQENRCRAALRMIDVPENIIFKFEGPILFQLAHLCCVIDEPMHWRDALRWIWDHKGEVFEHAKKMDQLRREQIRTATSGTDRPNDGDALVSDDKGQSSRVRDGGVPMGREEDPAS